MEGLFTDPLVLVLALVLTIGGMVFGYFLKGYYIRVQLKDAKEKKEWILEEAKREAETVKREALVEAREEFFKERTEIERELDQRRKELTRIEERFSVKEESLDKKADAVERQAKDLAMKENLIEDKAKELENQIQGYVKKLESVAGLSSEEAKNQLISNLEAEARSEAGALVKRIEEQAEKTAEEKAQWIVGIALQRCASEEVSENAVSTITIPSEDMKGRIIGREGRNIREFEKQTGVDLIIDDTPDAVVISAFDPVRREVARRALGRLVADGRIHPTRIEEVVNKSRKEVDEDIRKAGEETAYEMGIHNLRSDMVRTLGRLKYRTSYGQNVLQHSKEVALLGSAIAAELGVDPKIIKRAGLLHDIGKAVDAEVEGPHALVGADLAKRYNESPVICKAIGGHHGESGETTLESVIIQAADALSAARPGARRENIDAYVKRLEGLERIAMTEKGVEQAFAIQAGREVRVMVRHEEVDDTGAKELARQIAKNIEDELEYPGQIKVTVIRETRAFDFAR